MRSAVALAVALAAAWLPASAIASPRPPVIREPFTPLACPAHPVSTLDMEGCAEKAILAADARINALAKLIFMLLPRAGDRSDFVRGERSWLDYRRHSCAAESAAFAGGTLAAVADAVCQQSRTTAHVKDLAATLKLLRQH